MKRFVNPFLSLFSLSLLISLILVSVAVAVEYSYTTIDVPLGDDSLLCPLGINDSGQIVTCYCETPSTEQCHGILLDSNSFRTIDFPGAWSTFLKDINNAGQIVGSYCYWPCETAHGFLYDGESFRTIDFPSALWTQVLHINDVGQMLGIYVDGSELHGFMFYGDNFRTIDFPGAHYSNVTGINNAGQIVGDYLDEEDKGHGFLYDGESFKTIDFPGSVFTALTGINDSGQMVGVWEYWSEGPPEEFYWYAFLFDGNSFSTIDVPYTGSYFWFSVDDINNSGQITGCISEEEGAYCFLATPKEQTLELIAVKMVSPTELGIAVKAWFPEDTENTRRFIKFTGSINGQPVEKEIDVTDLTEPGQELEIGLHMGTLDYRTPLRINLKELGVPRFSKSESFELKASAQADNGYQSDPDIKEVKILLPVIFVHGYDGPPGLINNIFGDFVISDQVRSLFGHLSEATLYENFTTGYVQDEYWFNQPENGRCYKTLWFEHYSPTRWTALGTWLWLDQLIRNVKDFTWADRVDLVAHSLGGLVSRYYVTRRDGADKVDKVIMMGTPNKGSSKFYMMTDGWDYFKVAAELLRSPLAQWLIPSYQALYDIDGNPLVSSIRSNFPDAAPPENITYYSIYTTGLPTPVELTVGVVCPRYWPRCPERVFWYDVYEGFSNLQEGDGTVPGLSAMLDFDERVKNIPLLIETPHIWLPNDPGVQAEVLRALRE